ncbi:MAG: AraC family transcriptional regulator [Saprospiraceae bacterium]|nr:AraC family transcriptional regulator [Saprospiraceae bacterium]
MQFRARFIANLIQFARQQGASVTELTAITGLPLEDLNTDDLFFPAGIYNEVVETAVRQTGNSQLGLHLGDHLSLSAAGLIVQIVQSSQTVKEGIQYMVEYANLGCQAMPFVLTETPDNWELALIPNPIWVGQSPEAVRQTMDGSVLFTLREFHTLTRQKYAPIKIHFNYARPVRFREYEELLQCPVYWSMEYTAIYLEKSQVEEPVVTSDYRLLQVLNQYAQEKLLAMHPDSTDFAHQVKQSILNLVKPEFPTIERVASTLNISVRSLQRKLKEEGYTYQSLLEELKKQFAQDYLKNRNLSIKEIAYLLDYSEPSSFIRSFKRWTGHSPERFRKLQQVF